MTQPTVKQREQIEREKALAQHYWPDEYAKTMKKPGTNRRTGLATLRKRAVEKEKTDVLRAQGRNCGNCKHIDTKMFKQPCCSIDGDCWTGYTMVAFDNICPKHESAKT